MSQQQQGSGELPSSSEVSQQQQQQQDIVVALPLPGGKTITCESALLKQMDILKELQEVAENKSLYEMLWNERQAIEAIVRQHAGANCDPKAEYTCTISPTDEWIQGGFNVCIPVCFGTADGQHQKQLLFRCPLPYKFPEAQYPGTIDEKVGMEVGAYVWIQENCPDIRIPHLYGFGFSDGRQFTHAAHCPWYVRIARAFKRALSGFLGRPVPSRYVPQRLVGIQSPSAYVLLEHIGPETGQPIYKSWHKHCNDQEQRRRLFRGMARTILSLARVPQPRIGSFQFHDDGTISLTNRPLESTIARLENEGAPRTMPQNATYQATEAYVSDMLTFHDRSFLNHPNASWEETEFQAEFAAKAALRSLAHRYIRLESRTGPFILQHTDLHGGNVFVDDEWNVTCIIDLEWLCALPAESIKLPNWYICRGIDQLVGEDLVRFRFIKDEFTSALEEEEQAAAACLPLSRILRESWESGATWFWFSIYSLNAAVYVVQDHIVPKFTKETTKFREVMHQFWGPGVAEVIQAKLADKEAYDEEIRKLFGKSARPESAQEGPAPAEEGPAPSKEGPASADEGPAPAKEGPELTEGPAPAEEGSAPAKEGPGLTGGPAPAGMPRSD
ncbi:hypothetical protein RB594_006343 [Gaeumannomyces avenae]